MLLLNNDAVAVLGNPRHFGKGAAVFNGEHSLNREQHLCVATVVSKSVELGNDVLFLVTVVSARRDNNP